MEEKRMGGCRIEKEGRGGGGVEKKERGRGGVDEKLKEMGWRRNEWEVGIEEKRMGKWGGEVE